MVAPGAGFRGVTLFRSRNPEIGEDQKKGLRRKITGFSVQKQLKTKKRSLS